MRHDHCKRFNEDFHVCERDFFLFVEGGRRDGIMAVITKSVAVDLFFNRCKDCP